jgi:predicted alpha-1,6-mannanase (GH76 family)
VQHHQEGRGVALSHPASASTLDRQLLSENWTSKNQLESELHRAWSAHLIERTEDAERTRERSRRLAKSGLAKRWINHSEIRVIEYIERLRAEL